MSTLRLMAATFAAVALVGVSAGAAISAPPPPPSITLNSVTPFLDGANCAFTLNYTVNGLKGKPSKLWGVGAIVPTHIFPAGGTAGVGTVTKADNGVPKNGVPGASHPNDGHATVGWTVYLIDPTTNQVVALSGVFLSANSTCS